VSEVHDAYGCISGADRGVLYGYSGDAYNNLTDTYEYDYGKGPAPSTSCQAVTAGWTRHTNTIFNTAASYTSNNIVRLPQETKVFDAANSCR